MGRGPHSSVRGDPARGQLGGPVAAGFDRLRGTSDGRADLYVFVTILLVVLIGGMAAGLAFGGRLEERDGGRPAEE